MAKKSALQKIEHHEKICRYMQKQTFDRMDRMENRIARMEKFIVGGLGAILLAVLSNHMQYRSRMKIIREENKFTITDYKWDNKYSYSNQFRDDDNGPRTYKVGEKKVPSVTTILSATQSPEKKAGLDAWRERVGHQEAQRIMNQAATRGTEMHYVLENYINGTGYFNLSKEGAQARLMAHRVIEDGLGPLKTIYGSEVNLAYEDRWAGSTDLVGIFDDKPTIIDFKQSNKPKREEWIEDYYYQIAAYSLAHKKQHGEILQGFIAICTKDLLFQGFRMDKDKLSEYEDKWFKRVEQYYSTLATS